VAGSGKKLWRGVAFRQAIDLESSKIVRGVLCHTKLLFVDFFAACKDFYPKLNHGLPSAAKPQPQTES
jgi:hypothetical protein